MNRTLNASLKLAALCSLMTASASGSMQSSEDFKPEEFGSASKFYFGIGLGAGTLSDSGGSHLSYGARTGYRYDPYWSLGASLDRLNRGTITTPGGSADSNITFYGADLNYFLAWIPGVQVGATAALGDNSTTVNGTEESSNFFYYGPSIAYDQAIGGAVSVGGRANVLFAPSDQANDVVTVGGVIKLWL
jgi:hypothetical protein